MMAIQQGQEQAFNCEKSGRLHFVSAAISAAWCQLQDELHPLISAPILNHDLAGDLFDHCIICPFRLSPFVLSPFAIRRCPAWAKDAHKSLALKHPWPVHGDVIFTSLLS